MKRCKQTLDAARRGFTAIEISMVITVIAILALLIIPLFRDRVEAARRAAAQAEIQTFVKAEQLAFADTGFYFRLQDLDNTQEYNDPPVRPDQEVPIACWNRPLTQEERRKLHTGPASWKGPYITINRFKYMELRNAIVGLPEFFWSYAGRGGPIMNILTPGAADWWPDPNVPIANMGDHPDDRILVDPWGTPYLFFGTGRLNEEGGTFAAQESAFGNAAVFCLGPDGLPGAGTLYQGNPTTLLREWAIIGYGDDYSAFF